MARFIQTSLASVLLSTSLSYAQAPQRIISLSPNTTELIYSLGVADRLLAVSRFSNYPPEAATKPIIGDAFNVNTEQLVSLQPDLIVAWDSEPFSNSLKHLPNTRVWTSQPNTIARLLDDIQALADIVDSPKQAEVLTLKRSIHALAQKYRVHEMPYDASGTDHSSEQGNKQTPSQGGHQDTRQSNSQIQVQATTQTSNQGSEQNSVAPAPTITARPLQGMLLISQQPLYVLTRESIQSDALNICNTQNIFSAIHQGAAIVNRETILMNPPDFVVYGYSTEKERELTEHFISHTLGLSLNREQLIGIDSDIWSRPTARFLQALPGLCERIDALRRY